MSSGGKERRIRSALPAWCRHVILFCCCLLPRSSSTCAWGSLGHGTWLPFIAQKFVEGTPSTQSYCHGLLGDTPHLLATTNALRAFFLVRWTWRREEILSAQRWYGPRMQTLFMRLTILKPGLDYLTHITSEDSSSDYCWVPKIAGLLLRSWLRAGYRLAAWLDGNLLEKKR